jgi:hypothetical protein
MAAAATAHAGEKVERSPAAKAALRQFGVAYQRRSYARGDLKAAEKRYREAASKMKWKDSVDADRVVAKLARACARAAARAAIAEYREDLARGPVRQNGILFIHGVDFL